MMEKFKIRPSLYYFAALALFVLLTPLPGMEWAWVFTSIVLYQYLSHKGMTKKFSLTLDLPLIMLFTVVVAVGAIALGFMSLAKIGWIQLLLIAGLVELVGVFTGIFPVVGDFIGAIINVSIITYLVGGPTGLFVAMFVGFLTMLPGPTKGHNFVTLVGLKLLSVVLL